MTPHDRWLEPDDEPDEDQGPDDDQDFERDTDAFMEGDWGSDERDRLVEKTYDR